MSKPKTNLSLDNKKNEKIAQLGGKLGSFLFRVYTIGIVRLVLASRCCHTFWPLGIRMVVLLLV